jgi:hypothetical protein
VQAATFSLYIINILVFAAQMDCANIAVQIEPLYVIRVILRLKRRRGRPCGIWIFFCIAGNVKFLNDRV